MGYMYRLWYDRNEDGNDIILVGEYSTEAEAERAADLLLPLYAIYSVERVYV